MEDQLPNNTPAAGEEITAALREQRERARTFLSDWRGSSETVGQNLIAQLEAAARDLSAMAESDGASESQLEQREAELSAQAAQLDQLREEIDERESRLATLQEAFSEQHQTLLESLAEQHTQINQQREELAQQATQAGQGHAGLDERLEQLQALLDQLDVKQTALQQAQAEANAGCREHDVARAKLEQQQQELQRQQSELAAKQEELAQQRSEFEQTQARTEETLAQWKSRAKHLDEQEQRTHEARLRLARELKVRRKEQLAEIERRRIELEQIVASEDEALEQKLAEFQEELSHLQQQTDSRTQQVEDLSGQLEIAQSRLKQREAENADLCTRLEEIAAADHRNSAETAELTALLAEANEKAESQHVAAQAALASAREEQQRLRDELNTASGDDASAQRIRELESERDSLAEQLANAAESSAEGGVNPHELDDLQRRFETAMQDVRELKSRNAKLEEKLATAGTALPDADAPLDWEAQKKLMLAKLEADFDESDEGQAADKLTVAGAMSITDQVVADKEREIQELRNMLDDQSQNLGDVAVGAAAIAQMLDGDELVKSEREKLEVLQQEWREKLRKAEIDISVERAKIARERAQLEDRLQNEVHATISGAEPDSPREEKPKRGKWLARLGLGDEE